MFTIQPESLNFSNTLQTLNNNNNLKTFNENFSSKLVEVTGKFITSKNVLVNSTKNGVFGYDLFTPFEFMNENGTKQTLFVNRGFIEQKHFKLYNGNENFDSLGYVSIKGVLTMPNNNIHDSLNTYYDDKVDQVKLDEFATLNNLKNLVSERVYLTQVEDESSPKIFPIAMDRYSLTNFDVPLETHNSMSRMMNLLSFGVIFGNMYLWVCL